MREAERRQREIQSRIEAQQRETQRRVQEAQREAERRQQEAMRQAEERRKETERFMEARRAETERLAKEMQRQAERRQEESRRLFEARRADNERLFAEMERERTERYERLEQERIKREKAYQEGRTSSDSFFGATERGVKKRGIFSRFFRRESRVESPFDGFDYEAYFKTLFEAGDPGASEQQTTSSADRVQETVSPAERTRLRLMSTLPRDTSQALETFEPPQVRSVIATVYAAREADAERTDWDIYVSYRRAIEVEEPDPAMVQKTQIAGVLLEGTRSEAKFPF